MRVRFEKLERSELARQLAEERIGGVVAALPAHRRPSLVVTLTMDKSVSPSVPDLFGVRVEAEGGASLVVDTAAPSLYVALAEARQRLRQLLAPSDPGAAGSIE